MNKTRVRSRGMDILGAWSSVTTQGEDVDGVQAKWKRDCRRSNSDNLQLPLRHLLFTNCFIYACVMHVDDESFEVPISSRTLAYMKCLSRPLQCYVINPLNGSGDVRRYYSKRTRKLLSNLYCASRPRAQRANGGLGACSHKNQCSDMHTIQKVFEHHKLYVRMWEG